MNAPHTPLSDQDIKAKIQALNGQLRRMSYVSYIFKKRAESAEILEKTPTSLYCKEIERRVYTPLKTLTVSGATFCDHHDQNKQRHLVQAYQKGKTLLPQIISCATQTNDNWPSWPRPMNKPIGESLIQTFQSLFDGTEITDRSEKTSLPTQIDILALMANQNKHEPINPSAQPFIAPPWITEKSPSTLPLQQNDIKKVHPHTTWTPEDLSPFLKNNYHLAFNAFQMAAHQAQAADSILTQALFANRARSTLTQEQIDRIESDCAIEYPWLCQRAWAINNHAEKIRQTISTLATQLSIGVKQ